ncbi:sulfite exporter TauE/SafE family protein [Miniimonas arenae]|uniref:Probable membrane transporter protein n=1 Tax=Miniimonas arenae TaxID=676201 RepID=A0A5C5BGK8_9MICO|nr:sulfite exporter TauE/SafE family protein [Miniimonas arenae]TNU76880.1 sulfite exporter TauE/SafE family protein [Miniimonas arenae]
MPSPDEQTVTRTGFPRWATFVLIGLGAGLLSGLFGVGGGTVIVPALVAFAAFDRRMAAGTSLLAIVPTSIVGFLTYGLAGHVSVLTAAILAVGTVIGAQLGTWLLARLSQQVLRWAFVAFVLFVAVQLFFTVPVRGGEVEMTAPLVAGLVGLGLATGVLSGLLGVGGGVVVVPAMILLFGYSDLLAKGTSLLMMIPTAISGTIGNLRRKNLDVRAGLFVGLGACVTVTLGSRLAALLDPQVANWLFIAFLVFLMLKTLQDIVKARRSAAPGA